MVHAAGIIDFCEVGKLTVEGWGGTKHVASIFWGWLVKNHAMLVQDFPGKYIVRNGGLLTSSRYAAGPAVLLKRLCAQMVGKPSGVIALTCCFRWERS